MQLKTVTNITGGIFSKIRIISYNIKRTADKKISFRISHLIVIISTTMFNNKNIESFKLFYLYFFPVTFFPLSNIYQFRNNSDIKSWLFSNLLVSITVILIPLFLALSMLITKFLYRDHNKKPEYNAMGLGLLCLIFLMGSNYYQFQKFTAGTDLSIDLYRMALMLSFLIACFVSSLYFTLKYKQYSKKYTVDLNTKTQRFMASAALPLILTICALFTI